jgi:hypothetical protein
VADTVALIQMALAKTGEKKNSFSEVNLVLPAEAMGCSPYGSVSAPDYSHGMNEQHYFQSQKTEDSAHLGSIHAHAPARTPNNHQRHAAVKPSHDEIAGLAYNLFSESGYMPGHNVEH